MSTAKAEATVRNAEPQVDNLSTRRRSHTGLLSKECHPKQSQVLPAMPHPKQPNPSSKLHRSSTFSAQDCSGVHAHQKRESDSIMHGCEPPCGCCEFNSEEQPAS
uniref:Uncharacterized protein n=1 Tax=Mus musculus TaxID=10090 RepID=Q3V2H2_MOUSE|nr:unnamed protein product [Mus musculus]